MDIQEKKFFHSHTYLETWFAGLNLVTDMFISGGVHMHTHDKLPFFVCKSSKGSDKTLHLSRLTYLIGTISLAFILCIDLIEQT